MENKQSTVFNLISQIKLRDVPKIHKFPVKNPKLYTRQLILLPMKIQNKHTRPVKIKIKTLLINQPKKIVTKIPRNLLDAVQKNQSSY